MSIHIPGRRDSILIIVARQSLDIQYTVGIATSVPTTFYSNGNPFADGFIDTVNFLLAQDELPLVLTTSYGFNEPDFEGSEDLAKYVSVASLGFSWADYAYHTSTFCNAYAQLGARGTSVFFCSGDNGVYSFSFNSLCDATTFGPTFPSTCPLYVLSVVSRSHCLCLTASGPALVLSRRQPDICGRNPEHPRSGSPLLRGRLL